MRSALDLLDWAADAVAGVDLGAADPQALADGALGIQRHIDRMKVLHARVLLEADKARVWQGSGSRNVADWLATKTNGSHGDATSRVKLGDSLERSPELADAVESGEVSTATAEALHDTIAERHDDEDLPDLIKKVKGTGPRRAKEIAEQWKDEHAADPAKDRAERCHRRRSVRSAPPVDGLATTTVVLPVLETRELLNALASCAGKPSEHDDRTHEQRLADGLIQLCKAYNSGEVVGGRERPTLLITFSAEAYAGLSDEPGVTAQGDRIPADVVRHLAENAHLQRVVQAGSAILNLGRLVRWASHHQFRALVARDGGCRWPGCHVPASWCEADHLVAFADGGATDMHNLVLWCDHHHHVKHRSGIEVIGDAGPELRLRLPDGTVVHCPPKVRSAQAAA